MASGIKQIVVFKDNTQFERFVNNDSISKMFGYDGAHGVSVLFGCPQVCAAQPWVLMR